MSSDKPKAPYVLVPEVALLASLPAHQQARFETALTLMHNTLTDSLTWEEIAEKSAISAYHFHRQFTALFHETPGQYLSRIRLQVATSELIEEPELSITEVAHNAGYSSSQAFAKALKRQLGMTAKAIRQMPYHATPEETSLFLDKMAQPSATESIEQLLAKSLPCEVLWYPERFLHAKKINGHDSESFALLFGEQATKYTTVIAINQLENPWKDIEFIVGRKAQPNQANFTIPAGEYLCCEVLVVSEVGYDAAWEGIFQYAEEHGLDVDEQGFSVELVRHVDDSIMGSATCAIQIPLLN